MRFFLSSLQRLPNRPSRLAVVLMPLALLTCCATAAEAGSDVQRPESPVQATIEVDDYRESGFFAAGWMPVGVTISTGDQAANAISKAGWSLSKFRPTRRILERWAPSVPISLVSFSSGVSVAASPMLKAFGALSLEYLTLRQLRL